MTLLHLYTQQKKNTNLEEKLVLLVLSTHLLHLFMKNLSYPQRLLLHPIASSPHPNLLPQLMASFLQPLVLPGTNSSPQTHSQLSQLSPPSLCCLFHSKMRLHSKPTELIGHQSMTNYVTHLQNLMSLTLLMLEASKYCQHSWTLSPSSSLNGLSMEISHHSMELCTLLISSNPLCIPTNCATNQFHIMTPPCVFTILFLCNFPLLTHSHLLLPPCPQVIVLNIRLKKH